MTTLSAPPVVAPATRAERLRPSDLGRPLAAYAASRALVLTAIAVGNRLHGSGQSVADALHLWDGNWYLSAAAGYQRPVELAGQPLEQTNIAFFPAYPLAIRGAGALPGVSPLQAAIGVNLLAGALATLGVWLLVRRLSGRGAADRAAALFCLFPGSVVLSLVYSEPLMLTFAAGCLLALLDRRWLLAGLLAAAAGATRPNGVVLVACCAWAALAAVGRDRDWPALAAPAIAPLGFLGYLGWLWWFTGDPTIWLRVQRDGWGEHIDFGRRTVQEVAILAPGGAPLTPTILLQVLGLVVTAVAAVVLLWRWRPPGAVVVYAVGVVGLAIASQSLGARPRFLLTAFPLVAALAVATRGRRFAVLLGASAVGCAVLAALYTVPRLAVP